MDILCHLRVRTGSASNNLWWNPRTEKKKPHGSPCCSRRDSSRQSQNGDDNNGNNNRGDKSSTDWDKAWSSFKKQGKMNILSQFSPNKYVTWNPRRSNYPLSEEVDPIKRTERSNLMRWTSTTFTLGMAILIVSLLLLYTILAPMK